MPAGKEKPLTLTDGKASKKKEQNQKPDKLWQTRRANRPKADKA